MRARLSPSSRGVNAPSSNPGKNRNNSVHIRTACSPGTSQLPEQLQSKLDLALGRRRVTDRSGCWRRLSSRERRDDRHAKIGVVQQVETLHPKLRLKSF